MAAAKNVVFKLISSGFGLFVGLSALEIGLRLLEIAPLPEAAYDDNTPEADLAYRPKPSSHITGRGITDEFDYDYRHNSFGFRDVEHAVSKTPGTFRIMALGDSFTYGVGVRFEESYLFRLEELLNRRVGLIQKSR